MRKSWALSFVVLFAAAVLLAGPAGQWLPAGKAMATLTVCPAGCTATTINGAVALAAAGDTINVAAGTYNEFVTIPAGKNGLTINGANANVNPCTGTRGAESIVTSVNSAFLVQANNVIINGFTSTGGNNTGGITGGVGIVVASGTSGVQIINNIVTGNVFGIYLNGTGQLVQNNNINNNNNPGAAAGNGIYSDGGLANSTINANCITNEENAAVLVTVCGVASIANNVAITNNVIGNSAVANSGNRILVAGGSNYTITGNTIVNSVTHGVQLGGVNGAIVSSNTLLNGAFSGVRIFDGSVFGCPTALSSNIVINCNRIVNFGDNSIRLNNTAYTGVLNAENNFFGCNTGPGTVGCGSTAVVDINGTPINPAPASPTIDTTPYLILTLAANPSSIFPGQNSLLTASLNTNSDGATTGCGINGAPVAFASTCGTLNAAATTTVGGNGTSTLTANATLGSCLASATVDNQTVSTSLVNNQQPTMTIVDPFGCTGPGDVLNVTLTLTNAGAVAQTIAATATLPAGLLALPGTCTTNVPAVACTVVNGSTVTVTGALTANQVLTVIYQAQVGNTVTTGTTLTITTVATFGANATVTVAASTVTTCAAAGPGQLYPAISEVSDQKAGSILYYNIYTSGISPNAQNTRISITNTNPTLPIAVHLFFVDGASCSVADANICLTQNQTASFQASDLDPGTTGYIVAIAVDPVTGCPANFNFLIGDEYVKFTSGHAANLGAEAFSAIAGGLTFCNTNTVTAQLNFDGVSYNRAPRVLAVDSVASRADGNDTLLIINRVGGNLATGAATLINLFGLAYDDSENALSFGFGGSSSSPGTCQFRSSLSNTFPRLTPRFEQFIPAGRTGWLKIFSQADIGLLGAVLNANPNSATSAGAFGQGHNLHKLTLTTAATLTIPVFPPSC